MFYKQTVDEVLQDLDASEEGLSEDEVQKRLKIYGQNIIENEKKVSKISIFLKQFQDSMIIMLLIVSIISFVYSYIMHESFTDTILIVFIVFLNASMGFFQETKAEASLNSLKKVNNCKVKVKRNNIIYLCDSANLVPGDIIILEAGDKIPADARVIKEYSSLVDESILTGESLSVEKNNNVIIDDVIINDRCNMVYSGCDIIHGNITAVICTTGMKTELGKIASSIIDKKDVPTPLQLKISEISKNLSVIVIFIIGFVFAYNILVLHNNIIDIIMLCISLMVSAVPEGLPAVISICLSLGVKEMTNKKALVKTLSSVETLGATEVICSDKTGTITKNQMTVVKAYIYNKSIDDSLDTKELLNNMVLCNDVEFSGGKYIGDPTETALVYYAIKNDKNIMDKTKKYERIGLVPFDSERKMMSTINRVGNKNIMYSKGSLESILDRCSHYIINGKIQELSKKEKDDLYIIYEELAKEALRVISFAYKEVSDISNLKEDDLLELEDDLIFSGMVGMIDPPRDNVIDSINSCKEAGIIPVMITGDSLTTALAIAKNIGLATKDSEGIEGKELRNYSDEEMINLVKKYRVYARVSPEDKVKIVKAWQKNNKVVAMTGDGVNDAPAIKLAHIGIGMGQSGTEVTKSVADVILLDDCFNTIVSAVREGRRIYNNIRNVILYSLSSNFAELFIVIVGMFLNINILLPIQILFIDLFTDAILSICMAFEKEGNNIMKEPPHKSSKHFFTPFMTYFLILSAVIESALIYWVYILGYKYFNFEIAQSMAFLCLIVQEMIFAFNCRNVKEPLIKHGIFSNKFMNIGLLILIIFQTIIFISPIKNLLHVVTLNFYQVMIIVIVNIIAFLIIELIKPIMAKFLND